MIIGNIDLGPRPVLLAPMEDVTDIGFRLLCRRLVRQWFIRSLWQLMLWYAW